MSDPMHERLVIRMLHKICPAKATHAALRGEEFCPQCGIDESDYRQFVAGGKGRPELETEIARLRGGRQ